MQKDSIEGMFFSEFHTTTGPRIAYQVPKDLLRKEDFDIVSVFVITKPELRNNLITIKALGKKILGCPVIIDNKKYDRNALIFNLCLVFDACSNTEKYESITKKLANYLTNLEIESGLLSSEEKKKLLFNILDQLLLQLNQGECSIKIDQSTTINLKVIADRSAPVQVQDHDVPILYPDKSLLPTVQQLDLSTQQLVRFIDGFKHVAKIATEADVDISIVKACVQNLTYHGVMKIIPVFQFNNVYVVTPDINRLYENAKLQEECAAYIARPGKTPLLRDIFMMYCGLTSGTRVKDLCARFNTNVLGIDERKLIQFGLLRGFIRRLNKYPVKVVVEEERDARKKQHSPLEMLYNEFDGLQSIDQICCRYSISCQTLEDQIDNDSNIVVCWK